MNRCLETHIDPPPEPPLESVWNALLASGQGFGIVELMLGADGAPSDFRYLATNPAFDRESGTIWATGKPASEIMENFRSPWLEGFARVESTGVPWRSGMDWGGKAFHAEVLPAGPGRAAILFTDVTELRERERDLAVALERFVSTEQAAETGSFRWDLDTGLVERSLGLVALVGPGESESPIEPGSMLGPIHPDDRPASPDLLVELLSSFERTGHPWEPRLLLPDGTVRWFLVRARLLCDDDGRVLRVDGQMTDITARRRFETRLAESERRFRDLSNLAPVIIWATTPGGEVEFVNQAFSDFTGLDATGDWSSRIHPDDRNSYRAASLDAVARRASFSADVRVLHLDGEFRWLRVEIATRVGQDDEYLGRIGVATDETDQRLAVLRSQEARRAAEQANRLKSEFLAVMSHELRTPLNAIIGYSELLLLPGESPLTAAQRAEVEEITGAGQRLLLLVNDILDLSRIEAGEMTLELAPMDLASVLKAAVADIAPQAARKGLQVEVASPPDLPPLSSDQRALHQVLVNLLGNAVKFTNAGRVDVSVRVEEGMLAIAVTDTGIGMEADFQPFIFEPFRQGDASTTRRYSGSGLGLAIVRRLVNLMGGTLDVISAPGEGSTFTVRLPLT